MNLEVFLQLFIKKKKGKKEYRFSINELYVSEVTTI
jgi:hypothetical protein